MPAGQGTELLKLRGQVGVLRREKGELGQLHADNRRLRLNLIETMLRGNAKLSLQQVAPYLEAKQRNAESLLAAWRATGDWGLLREAAEKYPNDPRVGLAAYFGLKEGASPEERRSRLDALRQAAPDNALAIYLSAQEYFKAGQTDRALGELAQISSNAKLQDYSGDFAQSAEEAYLAAGFSALEAKTLATFGLQFPHWAEINGLGQSLVNLANRCRQGGDEASAQAALQMGTGLAQQVCEGSEAHTLIQDLVGIAIERRVLGTMDPSSPWGNSGQTVKDRLAELDQRRRSVGELSSENTLTRLQDLLDSDQIGFFTRMRSSGESEALRWLKSLKSR